MSLTVTNDDQLMREIDARRGDLIALTQELIRIPTLNPPGENYRDICEYMAKRLRPQGFEIELIRAEGTPGDCAKYPRWNVIARREGIWPGGLRAFQFAY